MKKHHLYLFLLPALLLSGSMNAKVNNYVGAYATLGEWSLLPSKSKYSTSFGVAGGLGFLYELQAGPTYSPTRFLFDVGVGAQGGMTSFMQGSSQEVTLLNQKDLDGETFDYVYEVKDRQDNYNNIAVQIPVMVGVQHRKFYMLAGVKLGMNAWTKTRSTALVTTYGKYTDIDNLRNQPEYQFFNDLKVSGGVKTKLKMNVDLSFEIGGRIGVVNDAVGYDVPKRKIEYRLAGFIDYGLMDIHYNSNQLALGTRDMENPDKIVPIEGNLRYNEGATAPVYNTRSMVDNLVMNDIMSTDGFAASVNNLMIGLKFTILFQLPEPGQCVLCHDSYHSLARPGGSRARMKYEE